MIRVLKDRVLIKCDDQDQMIGRIYIPKDARPVPVKGTVVTIGSGKLNKDGTRQGFTVNGGDRVIYDKFTGHEMFVDGVRHLSMPESEILAVVEE